MIYDRYKPIQKRASELGIIKKEDYDEYIQDIETMKKNITKLLTTGRKKDKIREQYEPLIEV